MKILVVGSGGREHAIAWRLANDPVRHELYCAPGNAGTAAVAINVPVGAEDVGAIAKWARENNPDLVVVGPEAPLVKGLVDELTKLGIPSFGPVAAGARMEGSKRFAKEVMRAAGVPTGMAEVFTDPVAAKAALAKFGLPVVIKADGLAAGKGVVVAETAAEAEAAIDDMLVANKFGAAGAEVLVEEFLDGEECSILAMTDGENVVLLPSSQDHKRIFDAGRPRTQEARHRLPRHSLRRVDDRASRRQGRALGLENKRRRVQRPLRRSGDRSRPASPWRRLLQGASARGYRTS